MGVNGQLHTPGALSSGNEPPVLIGLEGEWAPEPIWTLWRRQKKYLLLPAIEPRSSNL